VLAAKPAEGVAAQTVERTAEPARPGPIEARDTSAQPIRAAESPQPQAAEAPGSAEAAASRTAQASIVPALPSIRPPKPDAETAAPEAPRTAEPAAAPSPAAPKADAASVPRARAAAKPRPATPAASLQVARQPPPVSPKPAGKAADADALEALLLAQRRGPAEPGWSYEGETGPAAWGKLRPDWRLCSEGLRQSPIDLREGLAVDLAPVKFHYHATGFRIADTGNTLQVDVGGGMGMEVRGVRYELEHFSLHRPSQERVGGMAYDMVMHLEHRSADGGIAMLAVLLTVGAEPNVLLQTLWNNLPLDRGREFVPDATIDLAAFVPSDPAHFLYLGSLPTPPCTEDVVWVVMKTPAVMSADQLALFSRLYPRNARPIQPGNGRLLLESR
jgi:carbonic anhydrase